MVMRLSILLLLIGCSAVVSFPEDCETDRGCESFFVCNLATASFQINHPMPAEPYSG